MTKITKTSSIAARTLRIRVPANAANARSRVRVPMMCNGKLFKNTTFSHYQNQDLFKVSVRDSELGAIIIKKDTANNWVAAYCTKVEGEQRTWQLLNSKDALSGPKNNPKSAFVELAERFWALTN